MAIGGGDALLALLGGAAEKGNEIIDQDRAARARRIEQRQQQMLNSQMRIQENKYAADYKEYLTNRTRSKRYASLRSTPALAPSVFKKEFGFSDKQASDAAKDPNIFNALVDHLTQPAGEEPTFSPVVDKTNDAGNEKSAAQIFREKLSLQKGVEERAKKFEQGSNEAAAVDDEQYRVQTEAVAAKEAEVAQQQAAISEEERQRQLKLLSPKASQKAMVAGKKIFAIEQDADGNLTAKQIGDASTGEDTAVKLPEPKAVQTADGRVMQASWNGKVGAWIDLSTGQALGPKTKVASSEDSSQFDKEIAEMTELTNSQEPLSLEQEQKLSALTNKHSRVYTRPRTLPDGSTIQEIWRTNPLDVKSPVPVVTVETAGADMITFDEKTVQSSTNYLSANAKDSNTFNEASIKALNNLKEADRKQVIFSVHRLASRIRQAGITNDELLSIDMAYKRLIEENVEVEKFLGTNVFGKPVFNVGGMAKQSVEISMEEFAATEATPVVEPAPQASNKVVQTTQQGPKSQQNRRFSLEQLKEERARRQQAQ